MDGKVETNDERQQIKCIFPSAQVASDTNIQKSIEMNIFPSYATNDGPSSQTKDLDWLKNRSYTSDTAQKLVTFQQELTAYQQSFTEKERTSDDSRDQVAEARVSDKRELSDVDSEEDSRSGREKHRKHKHKHKKKHKKHKKDGKEKSGPFSPTPVDDKVGVFSSNKVFIEDIPDLVPEEAYRLDRKQDQNNWVYGSIYKLNVARYRAPKHVCLGLSGKGLMDYMDNERSKKEKKHGKDSRYHDKENRTLIRAEATDIIISNDTGQKSMPESKTMGSYIAVSSKVDNCKLKTDARDKILDSSTQLYVEGKGRELKLSELEDVQNTQTLEEKGLLEETAKYNKRTRENPTDVKLWLEFVKFQDKVAERNPEFRLERKKGTSLALLEKKLSIMEKALEHNPACIELQLAYIELCSEKWEPVRINKELEKLLFVHQENVKLWKYYLMYNQSRLSVFTVAKVTKLYHKCLRTLVSILGGKIQVLSVPDNLEKDILDVFVQYCIFLKQAGYTEKAIASFQALVEYNLYCPLSLCGSTPQEEKVAVFESFWDSGAARVGEPGATGWATWLEKKGASHVQPAMSGNTEEAEEAIVSKGSPKWKTWLEIEMLRSKFHWLPWRPDATKDETEEDCEDLDRLVLFDDITPGLLPITNKNLHFNMVFQFLALCGVGQSKLGCRSIFQERTFNHPESKDSCCRRALQEVGIHFQSHRNETAGTFVKTLVQQLSQRFDVHKQTTLSELLLGYLCSKDLDQNVKSLTKSDLKEVRKCAKTLLKESQHRNNLTLWGTYITIERLYGKPDEAKAIVETALGMFSGEMKSMKDCRQLSGLWDLYAMYAEILLNMKAEMPEILWEKQTLSAATCDRVVQVLSYVATENKFKVQDPEILSSSAVLKARVKFKGLFESIDDQLRSENLSDDSGLVPYFTAFCKCYALFELCSSQNFLAVFKEALSVITKLEVLNPECSCLIVAEESLLAYKMRLIVYHMSTELSSLHILREHLEKALLAFPENSSFLHLFVSVEQRSHIAGRMRRYFEKAVRNPTSEAPVLFAVTSELARLMATGDPDALVTVIPETGILHRVRSVLDRALSAPSLQRSPLLWRIYIHVEIKYGDKTRAKGVFYRALQQCPWIKDLYVDGVSMFGEEELQEIVDLMTEKEIRLQIPVEEVDILLEAAS